MKKKDLIAKGGHRHVYTTEDPNIVVKIQQGEGRYNRSEWEVWVALKNTTFAKHLVPCIDISPCGMYLLQQRGTPLPDDMPVPDYLLPRFLQHDTNLPRQWVMIDGQPRLCDYDHNQHQHLKKMNLL